MSLIFKACLCLKKVLLHDLFLGPSSSCSSCSMLLLLNMKIKKVVTICPLYTNPNPHPNP